MLNVELKLHFHLCHCLYIEFGVLSEVKGMAIFMNKYFIIIIAWIFGMVVFIPLRTYLHSVIHGIENDFKKHLRFGWLLITIVAIVYTITQIVNS